jgi:hypothetical protein
MFALIPKADNRPPSRDVRSGSQADIEFPTANARSLSNQRGRLLYPRKLPRYSLTGVSTKGQKQTFDPQARSVPGIRRPLEMVKGCVYLATVFHLSVR